MTNREKLNSMTDEQFADWLCSQIWSDYTRQWSSKDVLRYRAVINFLDLEYDEERGRLNGINNMSMR